MIEYSPFNRFFLLRYSYKGTGAGREKITLKGRFPIYIEEGKLQKVSHMIAANLLSSNATAVFLKINILPYLL